MAGENSMKISKPRPKQEPEDGFDMAHSTIQLEPADHELESDAHA